MFKKLILILVLLATTHPVSAQIEPEPMIVSFTANRTAISLQELEAGPVEVTLSWQVINVERFSGIIEVYQRQRWVPLAHQSFNAVDSLVVQVEHPRNFAPPTFRLSLEYCYGCPSGGNGRAIIDEWTLIIPYQQAEDSEPPQIESFTTDTEIIPPYAEQFSPMNLSWKVSHRSPTSQIKFEQILPDGNAVGLDLSYISDRWVRSEDRSFCAPQAWQNSGLVRIRMSVFDVFTGQIFDQAEVTAPIEGQSSDARPASSQSDIPPALVSFTANPAVVSLSDLEAGPIPVTLAWHVANQDQFNATLEVYGENGWEEVSTGVFDAVGSLTVPLEHPRHFAPPTFRLSIDKPAAEWEPVPDQWSLVVPYLPDHDVPHIAYFTTNAKLLPPDMSLAWKISSRTPSSQVILEQILPDGTAIRFDTRPWNAWKMSEEQTVWEPQRWQNNGLIRIRLRVVDVFTGEVYDQAEVTAYIPAVLSPEPTFDGFPTPTLAPP
ncbi:MAG TPA: hypothetical protein VHP83_18400 [Aggregatilineaceae bacterium]|nr:hypothetical protein [Aggregatilineaceae bacterium]